MEPYFSSNNAVAYKLPPIIADPKISPIYTHLYPVHSKTNRTKVWSFFKKYSFCVSVKNCVEEKYCISSTQFLIED
jgi:hypothetical protein